MVDRHTQHRNTCTHRHAYIYICIYAYIYIYIYIYTYFLYTYIYTYIYIYIYVCIYYMYSHERTIYACVWLRASEIGTRRSPILPASRGLQPVGAGHQGQRHLAPASQQAQGRLFSRISTASSMIYYDTNHSRKGGHWFYIQAVLKREP